ncbi:MAG: SURF1 family protein [Sphingomonadaceae bacterium]
MATMIALGVWQLQRAHRKEGLIARYSANATRPAMAFPAMGPVSDDAMFRASQVNCLRVAAWRTTGGRAMTGRGGTRHIAECTTSAEGPGALVDMGVSTDPKFVPLWSGGPVAGTITTEPDRATLIDALFGTRPVLRPMLVATTAAPGLAASTRPTATQMTNNHRAYAVQWFVFAAIALVVFAVALGRRSAK